MNRAVGTVNASKSLRLEAIAWIQLERAIRLFLDEQDYVSSLTLAGAAEEILGALLRYDGGTAAIDNWKSLIAAVGLMEGDVLKGQDIKERLNYARNSAKHVFEDQILEISKEHAVDVLGRAISNWTAYTRERPDVFIEFYQAAHREPIA